MYRTVRADKIISTAAGLADRVRARFPESDLLRVAEEVLAVARETEERCRLIQAPNVARPLRMPGRERH